MPIFQIVHCLHSPLMIASKIESQAAGKSNAGAVSLQRCLRKPLAALLAIIVYVFSHSTAIAADDHDLPFADSGHSGAAIRNFIAEQLLAAETFHSCQTEIEQYCSSETQDRTNSCLLRQHDNLSTCCASNIRRLTGDIGIRTPEIHAGITLPEGSEYDYYGNCQLNGIMLSDETRLGELAIGPGWLKLDSAGGVGEAFIVEGQVYQGLPIANGAAHGTYFHETGVPKEVIVAEDVGFQGMQLKAGSLAAFHSDGSLLSAVASLPFVDSRGRELIGKIEFHPTGPVKIATLAEPWKTPGIELPSGTVATFTNTGDFESIWIGYDLVVTGFKQAWGQHDTYANGQIRALTLKNQSGVAIDGVAYPEFTTIEFAEDGHIVRDNFHDKSMTPSYPMAQYREGWRLEDLVEPRPLGAWQFPARSVLVTDERGVPRSATLANNIKFKGIELAAGHIEFQSGGRDFWGAVLNKPYQQGGLHLPTGTNVSASIDGSFTSVQPGAGALLDANPIVPDSDIRFHREGAISEVRLDAGARLLGHQFAFPVDVKYDPSGQVSLSSGEPVSIGTLEFDGDAIVLHPEGFPQSGVLNANLRIDGILYAAGTEILLDESGRVIHSLQRERRWPDGKPPVPTKVEETSGGTILMVQTVTERVPRAPMMAPISAEECEELFGTPDASGTYPRTSIAGFSMSSPTPAEFGCGITDAQAGILDRG